MNNTIGSAIIKMAIIEQHRIHDIHVNAINDMTVRQFVDMMEHHERNNMDI